MSGTLSFPRRKTKAKNPRFDVGLEYDPIWAHKINPRKTIANFGVEIEMGFNCYPYFCDKTVNDIYNRIEGYAILKTDCGGMEIVSVPLNFEEIRIYLKTLLENPIPCQQAPDVETWGMHVHYSANKMKNEHLHRVLKFMLRTRDEFHMKFMRYIAGRSVKRGWGRLPTIGTLKGSCYSYSEPWLKSSEPWLKSESERFGIAINTQHRTHEFRLFGTTNDPAIACSNVEFVQALADSFRDDCSEAVCENTNEFIRFVRRNGDIYPHLAARLAPRKFRLE